MASMRQQLNDRGYASAGKQRRSTANPLKAISAFANQLGIPPKLTSVRDFCRSGITWLFMRWQTAKNHKRGSLQRKPVTVRGRNGRLRSTGAASSMRYSRSARARKLRTSASTGGITGPTWTRRMPTCR